MGGALPWQKGVIVVERGEDGEEEARVVSLPASESAHARAWAHARACVPVCPCACVSVCCAFVYVGTCARACACAVQSVDHWQWQRLSTAPVGLNCLWV